eukprot:317622-Chlamydomonas_euryale.AAC.1
MWNLVWGGTPHLARGPTQHVAVAASPLTCLGERWRVDFWKCEPGRQPTPGSRSDPARGMHAWAASPWRRGLLYGYQLDAEQPSRMFPPS